MLDVTPAIQIPESELRFSFARSSGPGGQNVNKVSSKAILHWPVATSPSIPDDVRERFLARYGSRVTNEGEVVITSERYRDQPRNVQDCLDKLREMLLAVAKPPRRRRKTKPTKGSIERRLQSKREKSEKKERRRSPRTND